MAKREMAGLAARIGGDGANAWGVLVEARKRKAAGEDVLILSIGEDAAAQTDTGIVASAVASLNKGRHHYSAVAGEVALREAIAEQHRRVTGQDVTADHIVTFAGAQNGIFSAALCLLEAGTEVVLVDPYYSTYPATFTAGGATLVSVQARAENGFVPDAGELEAAITPRTRAVVLNTPNNPTGAIYSREVVQHVVDLSRKHGFWIISDEVYSDFVFEGEHISPAGMCSIDEQCVVVSSLSKSHRMSGWRVGWAVAAPDLALRFEELNLAMTYGLPPFIQDAAITALTGDQTDTQNMVAGYGERAGIVVDALAEVPGITTVSPKAGMYVMVNVGEVARDAETFAWALMDRHNISILPCHAFGANVGNFLRMSLCASQADLLRACDAIADVAANP